MHTHLRIHGHLSHPTQLMNAFISYASSILIWVRSPVFLNLRSLLFSLWSWPLPFKAFHEWGSGRWEASHVKFFHVIPNLVPAVGLVLTSMIVKAMDAGNALSVLFYGCCHTSHTRSCVICIEMGKWDLCSHVSNPFTISGKADIQGYFLSLFCRRKSSWTLSRQSDLSWRRKRQRQQQPYGMMRTVQKDSFNPEIASWLVGLQSHLFLLLVSTNMQISCKGNHAKILSFNTR